MPGPDVSVVVSTLGNYDVLRRVLDGYAAQTVPLGSFELIVVVDRADRIPFAVRVGRRSLGIARQSVVVGLGLSVGAMGIAALGYLPPVWGALFQEVIDVAVILNALRALRG